MSKKKSQKKETLEILEVVNQKTELAAPYKMFAAVLGVSLILNIYQGYTSFLQESEQDSKKGTDLQNGYNLYRYISKRVFVEDPNDVIINFVPLRIALREYIEKQNGKVGIYFEYLPSGISVGVNDREEVKLASLSKVPLVMSILKKVEKNEISLDDIVVLKKEDLNQKFGDLWKRGEGATFTVQELIEKSLMYSDNTAYEALFRLLTTNEVVEVYDNLEIEVTSKDTNPKVSPKSYSSIFRSLYLASYLSKEDSNYILEVLTRTIFKDKIPAGVPDNIPIAHKIGVFSVEGVSGEVFTDCGIVYAPQRPYILCIFVKGTNEEAEKYSSYISNMIYQYVQMVKGGNK